MIVNQTRIRVAILGSTGSIGRQTLDVIRSYPDRFEVVGLAAGGNVELLATQISEFEPQVVACNNPQDLRLLVDRFTSVTMTEMATMPEVDVIMSAVVGKDGLLPALKALEAGKVVALANKEAMVMAGPLMRAAAQKGGGEIRPVDSEHSAIWQCLAGEDPASVRKLIITASGGALRELPVDELSSVTPVQALAHPNWDMGRRITIDSASLFNKGLEVIEARWLFDVPFEQIEVVLHRESIIHSMIEMVDGSLKAHLSVPDMRQPIQFALTYPERLTMELPGVDFVRLGALHFGQLDMERYPCLGLALAAGRKAGTYPAAVAAADEIAVEAFLDERLNFTEIPHLLTDTMERHESINNPSLEAVMDADAWARQFAASWIEKRQ